MTVLQTQKSIMKKGRSKMIRLENITKIYNEKVDDNFQKVSLLPLPERVAVERRRF